MPYEARTAVDILKELVDWTETASSLVEGQFGYDVLASNGIEFAKLEGELAEAYAMGFGHTATGDYLVLKAGESGVYRKGAKKSTGKLEVTGNGQVYRGAVFATGSNERFVAVEDVVIAGSGTVLIEAEVAGTSGNVGAETINRIPLSIAGIRSCNNPEATYDGYDEESDEELRERYLEKVRYPAASGNPRNYIQWAMEVTGVGAVRVQRCWSGPGTVRVVIIDANYQKANVDLIERVWTHIEEERPIGADVSVVSAVPKAINIKARIKGLVDVEAFKRGVTSYFVRMTNLTLSANETVLTSGEVSIAQINSYLIAAGGADDVFELELNGKASNVLLGIEEIPVLGEVELR